MPGGSWHPILHPAVWALGVGYADWRDRGVEPAVGGLGGVSVGLIWAAAKTRTKWCFADLDGRWGVVRPVWDGTIVRMDAQFDRVIRGRQELVVGLQEGVILSQ